MMKLSFGINAVQAGQKSATVNAEPKLIANCTLGKFTLTAPVTKALGIAVGDNVMFLNNISGIEEAIQKHDEGLYQWAAENSVDLNTRAGQEAVIEKFTTWFVTKGLPMFDRKGNAILASERYTKEDKMQYIKNNAATILEGAREELIARVGNPDATDEELIAALTPDDIESPKYHVNSGSRTASNGSATGVGNQVTFTDTAIWNALKANLGELKEKKNRIFKVDLENGVQTTFNDGCKDVDIMVYPIEFTSDENPVIRGEKKA